MDNCAGQFKDRHTFLQVATSCDSRDTTTIHCMEMKNVRVAKANDCYEKLGKELTKTGKENYIKKLLEYEHTGDKRVLENTTPRTRCTFDGFGTEDKDEYEQLLQA
eukprot:3988746-Ditylum_brightwellii.AAC.1